MDKVTLVIGKVHWESIMRDEISIISTNNANYPTNHRNNFFFVRFHSCLCLMLSN